MRNVLAVLGISFFLAVSAPTYADAQSSSETYRQLDLFGEVFNRVRADYVDEVDDEKLIEAAVNGMLQALDPHSGFLNAKNFREMQVQTRGEFGGLGIEVTMENGFVKVISPIDGTPAERAGILTNDLITHIGGEQIQGLTLSQAVEKMRGPVNTDIRLTVVRPGVDAPFDVTLTREVIRIASVRSRIEDDIAYLRVTTFSEQTASGLAKEIREIKEELGDTLAGAVLDLRGNPGGLLDQAVKVSDAFLEQGEIVSTRGRQAGEAQRFNAKSGDLIDGLPLVVLINGGSASASEIVAGALQDHGRAVVLGTQSFGKGSVQTIIPIAGHGAVRLTTSLYYTPSGRSIQAKGISPDIVVEQARLESLQARRPDLRRSEANLRNHIEIDGEDEDGGKSATADERPFDFQLARALDLLRGLQLFAKKSVN
ncbi:MAG: S41 family peptidase [Alphaproteobacteria bacterium]